MASNDTKNQPKAPPPSAALPAMPPDWVRDNNAYLEANGWEREGTAETGVSRWADPQSKDQSAKKIKTGELRSRKDGQVVIESIVQSIVPTAPWSYDTITAVGIQRARDKNAKPDARQLNLNMSQLS